MTTAKTREDYVQAWTDHIKELVYVAGEAGQYKEWKAVIEPQLLELVNKAADKSFGLGASAKEVDDALPRTTT